MKKLWNISRMMGQLGCWPYIVGLCLVVALAVWWVLASRGDHLEAKVSQKIDVTPAQVKSIQDIGQWEFLTVTDEELVDTVRHGFFGDDELMRIYYGTLRLGIDLHKAKPQWLSVEQDSVVTAVLPPVELLDRNFIDEARTKAFFESGSWTARDRQQLYDKAYRQMLARCLTPANVKAAERNAIEQMTRLLRTMGFSNVSVTFEQQAAKKGNKDANAAHSQTNKTDTK